MGTAFLLLGGFFVAGFVPGALINHPNEQPAGRLRKIVGVAWIAWTVLCAVIEVGLLHKVCPPGGCIGFLAFSSILGMLLGWFGLGFCATLGFYVARSYLRNHP